METLFSNRQDRQAFVWEMQSKFKVNADYSNCPPKREAQVASRKAERLAFYNSHLAPAVARILSPEADPALPAAGELDDLFWQLVTSWKNSDRKNRTAVVVDPEAAVVVATNSDQEFGYDEGLADIFA